MYQNIKAFTKRKVKFYSFISLEIKHWYPKSIFSEIPEAIDQSISSNKTAFMTIQKKDSRNRKYSNIESEYTSSAKTQDAREMSTWSKPGTSSMISKIFRNGKNAFWSAPNIFYAEFVSKIHPTIIFKK